MIYLKNINGVPTPAPNVYEDANGIIPAFNQNVELMLANGYVGYDEGDYSQYLVGAKTFVDGEFVDIPTPEYTANQKAAKLVSLQSQIDALDIKRVRAIAEPSVKDISTGQTWLEYYTTQVADLRSQIVSL